jgi:hypothetical protein
MVTAGLFWRHEEPAAGKRAMNNPEVTMHEFCSCRGFQAYQKAVEAAGIAVGLALKVPAVPGTLEDR